MKREYQKPDMESLVFEMKRGTSGYICEETAIEVLSNRRDDDMTVEKDDEDYSKWGNWWND